MLILILTFGMMLLLVFLELALQRWLFRDSAEKSDPEWELYQETYD